jgi:hypothetical protein
VFSQAYYNYIAEKVLMVLSPLHCFFLRKPNTNCIDCVEPKHRGRHIPLVMSDLYRMQQAVEYLWCCD